MRKTGAIINREPFGPLTGTMVPPSISNTIAIIESLLAPNGVMDITVGYGNAAICTRISPQSTLCAGNAGNTSTMPVFPARRFQPYSINGWADSRWMKPNPSA